MKKKNCINRYKESTLFLENLSIILLPSLPIKLIWSECCSTKPRKWWKHQQSSLSPPLIQLQSIVAKQSSGVTTNLVLAPGNRQISSLQVLKLMTKTYDLSGREKGPPKISKLDTINKQINKVIVKRKITELFIATFTFSKWKSFCTLSFGGVTVTQNIL